MSLETDDPGINRAKQELCFRELARRRMEYFIRYTYGEQYLMGWVHRNLCEELDQFLAAVQHNQSPRLMICMPPRHGKSEIASRRFPAYVFGKEPDLSIISASYAASLSSRINRDVQRIIDSNEYRNIFPHTRLSNSNVRTISGGALRNSDIFEIVGHTGSYRSAGVGGGITGMGADILIIDDPVKDRADADSVITRERIYDWYTSTAYTRLSPGGGILLIMTRWHEDDLAGRILTETKDNANPYRIAWKTLRFPAVAESDEVFRKEGEPLHPERYSLEHLKSTKASLPDRDWACLYQQNPIVDGGNVFKREWIRYWTEDMLPNVWDTACQSWDMTFSDSNTSDFVVGQVWGRNGADFYLLDQVRDRMDFVSSLDSVVWMTEKHPKVLAKLVEEKANGAAVLTMLKSKVSGLIPILPRESKQARAVAVTPLFRSGNVYVPDPRSRPWVKDLVTELTSFPAAAHDDQVDACTQALSWLIQHTAKPMSEETRRRLGFR